MATLKSCRHCRYFQGVVHYKKDSVGVLHDGIVPGWYVKCGDVCILSHSMVYVSNALGVDPTPYLHYINYQALMEFMRLNVGRRVECPRGRESKSKGQERVEQLSLL